jgi:hypothetical protein
MMTEYSWEWNDKMIDQLHEISQNIIGAQWYFENDAEIKGWNFLYAAQAKLNAYIDGNAPDE